MAFAPATKRPRQKTGTWTRKKLRRKRRAEELARGVVRDDRKKDPIQKAFPHLKI